MSEKSTIEWTDATWNPVRGCTKISPGCAHCYAATFAERFRGVPGHPYEQGFDLRLVPEKLGEPFNWSTPKKVFVNSMSDLFQHGDVDHVPDAFIERVCEVMQATPWHTYQVLTKRHERMRDLLGGPLRRFAALPNVWWGVSVENRKHGLPRVDAPRAAPAAVRFLSVEPLLEALGPVDLAGVHWVIVGGESGHGARPFDPAWAISLRDQCTAAGVAFFHKQNGSHVAGDKVRNKKANGRLLDGRTHDDMPDIPVVAVPPKRGRVALAQGLGLEVGRRTSLLLAEGGGGS